MGNIESEEIEVEVVYPDDVDINTAVAELVLSRGDDYETTVALRRGDQLHVGRMASDKDAKRIRLQINDLVVSKDQFRIYMVSFEDDKTISYMFYCEDFETLNGTEVNGTSIGSRSKPGMPFLLTHGDKIFVQPNWNFVFKQLAGDAAAELEGSQREDSLFFKERYHISSRCLGSGQFSKVLLANDVSTKKQLACKILDLSLRTSKRELARLIDEVKLLQKMDHPNIITLQKAFQSKDSLFLFLDLAPGGDLMSFVLDQGGILCDTYTLVIIRQVTLAVDYLHRHNIVHRDLKPENILVMHNDIGHRVVVADFGCASVIRSAKRMDSHVGTANYLAPEIHEGQRLGNMGYTMAVDLWSLGVLTYTLFTGEHLIESEEQRVDQRSVQERLQKPPHAAMQNWSQVTSEAKDFVAKLLVVDPRRRMSAPEAVRHDWFTKDKKMAQELEQLSERANKDWKPRKMEEGVFETIPGADENSPPKPTRAPSMRTSEYFSLDKHLRSYGHSQRKEAARTKQNLIDQLKETGKTFVQTTDMSTYTPKKSQAKVQFWLPSQDAATSPHTPGDARPRIETPRTPTKGGNRLAIRHVDARDMFGNSPEEEADSPSRKPLRESQITTQGEEEGLNLLSRGGSQGSMLFELNNNDSPSLGREVRRSALPVSSAPFPTMHSLTTRQKTPEPESFQPPEPTGFSMEIEELLEQQFSSVNTRASIMMSQAKTTFAKGSEKRKLEVFEDDEDELTFNPVQKKRRPAARYDTLTQEDKDMRNDVMKTLPQMTSAKTYGEKIKEKKQGFLSSRK